MAVSAYRAAMSLPGLVTGLAPLLVALALGSLSFALMGGLLFSSAAGGLAHADRDRRPAGHRVDA